MCGPESQGLRNTSPCCPRVPLGNRDPPTPPVELKSQVGGGETDLGIFAREGGPEEERDEPRAQGGEPPHPQPAALAPSGTLLPTSSCGSVEQTRRKRLRADRKPRPSRGSAQRYSGAPYSRLRHGEGPEVKSGAGRGATLAKADTDSGLRGSKIGHLFPYVVVKAPT